MVLRNKGLTKGFVIMNVTLSLSTRPLTMAQKNTSRGRTIQRQKPAAIKCICVDHGCQQKRT